MAKFIIGDDGLITAESAWQVASAELMALHRQRMPEAIAVSSTASFIQAAVAYAVGRDETSAFLPLMEFDPETGKTRIVEEGNVKNE